MAATLISRITFVGYDDDDDGKFDGVPVDTTAGTTTDRTTITGTITTGTTKGGTTGGGGTGG